MFFFQPRREQHGLAGTLVLHGRFGTPQHDRSDVRLTDKIIFVFRHGGDAFFVEKWHERRAPETRLREKFAFRCSWKNSIQEATLTWTTGKSL
jgi:hypothetical protein